VVRSPVNEVVISVSLQPQPVLESPRLLVGLSLDPPTRLGACSGVIMKRVP
jgi:hypothetical protein